MKKFLLGSLAALVFSQHAQAQIPHWLPSSGLAGWYPFDSNANDKSGNGNNGTAYNALLVQDRFGNNNKAYEFDGVSSLIEIPDHASLRMQKVTMAAWVMPSYVNGTFDAIIVKSGKNYAFNESYAMTTMGMSTKYNSNCQPGGWYEIHRPVSVNTWQLLVSTFDGDSMRAYINDSLVSTGYVGGLLDTCIGGTLRFGYNWDVYPDIFNGIIDDVSIYNRALNTCEIRRLYRQNHTGITTQPINATTINSNAQFSIVAPGTGLSYHWQENTGSGFTNLSNGGRYSGVTTNTLNIAGIVRSMDNNKYRCIVTATGLCPDTSASANLTVPTFVQDVSNDDVLFVYPNPASSHVTIKAEGLSAGAAYYFTDQLGRKVITGTITGNEHVVSMASVSSGIYFLYIEGKARVTKVVKQ